MKPKRPPMRTPGYTRSQHWQDVLLITVLSIALILCALYIVDWYRDRARVQSESASYRQSYVRDERPARPAPSTAPAASGTSEGMEIVTDIPTATRGADTPATLQSMEIVTDIPTDAVPVATGIPNISGAEPIIVDTPLENAAPDDDADDVDADEATFAVAESVEDPGENDGASEDESGADSTDADASAEAADSASIDEAAVDSGESAASNAAATTPAPARQSGTAQPALPTLPVVVDMPILPDATPDANTLFMLLPTPPPVQPSFGDLIALNPDTVGYLEIDELISLPVAQRENDNEYYLDHSFGGSEAKEGALFMDGANRLVPEDDCLIIYGHNMRNDTMFGQLDRYLTSEFLHSHPIVHFDTIYENRLYAPFAVFTASMEPDNGRYFDVRQFVFDEVDFELFALKLKSRSIYDIDVDAEFGDRLLLLVTCEYTNDNGRLILALRELRDGETESDMAERVRTATEK